MADQSPIEFDGALLRGGIFTGRPVKRVVFYLDDGRTAKFDLPEPGPIAPGDQDLSTGKQRILRVLRESDVPLTRRAIANKLGLSDTRGRFGSEVSELFDDGRIFGEGGLYTDDRKKYQKAT
jgi:hypothetical protein